MPNTSLISIENNALPLAFKEDNALSFFDGIYFQLDMKMNVKIGKKAYSKEYPMQN